MHSEFRHIDLEEVVRIERAARAARAAIFLEMLRGAFRALWRAWTAHQARAQLEALDPRLLKDIGLTRHDIDAALEGRLERRIAVAPGNDNRVSGAANAA